MYRRLDGEKVEEWFRQCTSFVENLERNFFSNALRRFLLQYILETTKPNHISPRLVVCIPISKLNIHFTHGIDFQKESYLKGPSQLLVSCDGQWMGCVSSHVHTNRRLMWDTLEDFAAILTIWQGTRTIINFDETNLRTSTLHLDETV